MDFVKKILHQISRKSEAVSQITFDEDYNVPDARPDVGRMIQKKGEVTIGDVQISEGKARVFGGLTFHLLYVSDGERRRICQLSGELPIDETIHLDGLTGGDKVCITWEVEDLNLHLINSRKLGVRAIVTLHAWIEELCDLAVPMEIRGESDVAVKRQEYRVVELAVQKKDVLRVKKELTIPSGKPELHEILWQDLEVRGLDLRSEEGRVSAQGELFVFCLYSDGEEDHPLQWVEQALPFQAEVECQGCISEMIPRIESTLGQTTLEIQPDSDGEERVLQAEAVLELDICLYQEETVSLLQDVYHPHRECIPKVQEETLESLLIRNSSKCRLTDKLQMRVPKNKILQICHSDGKIKIDEERIVENGIEVTGVVELRALYVVSDDEMPFYAAETTLPFRHTIEVPGIGPDCHYELQSSIDQLSTTMPDSSDIEAKVVLNLNALVFRRRKEMVMQYVEEKDRDPEELQNLPGITCYFVKPGDTLWDIAKKFYTTTDKIRELNELKTETLTPMQQLLVERV